MQDDARVFAQSRASWPASQNNVESGFWDEGFRNWAQLGESRVYALTRGNEK
jgi:hypothetical protein